MGTDHPIQVWYNPQLDCWVVTIPFHKPHPINSTSIYGFSTFPLSSFGNPLLGMGHHYGFATTHNFLVGLLQVKSPHLFAVPIVTVAHLSCRLSGDSLLEADTSRL